MKLSYTNKIKNFWNKRDMSIIELSYTSVTLENIPKKGDKISFDHSPLRLTEPYSKTIRTYCFVGIQSK